VCVTVCSDDWHSLLHSIITHYKQGTYQYALTKSRVSIGQDKITEKKCQAVSQTQHIFYFGGTDYMFRIK
jgi:hypothetical protein